MTNAKKLTDAAGWLVFLIAFVVYIFSVESTGSLWDCGEFILGAYKLQVVHPPGAPFFLLMGRLATLLAELFTDTQAHPENIAIAVNLLSAFCTALAAAFVAWTTIILGRRTLQEESLSSRTQTLLLGGAGVAAGLATAFATSIWFSAVEGEVYAMSTCFTTIVLWAGVKWYDLPEAPENDRWLIFAVFMAGLSIGVHLLSLLTFPALALFYYFKKYEKHTWLGIGVAAALGIVAFLAIQKLVITGIPELWRVMELMMVNGFGLPFHSGLVPTVLLIAAFFWFALRYARQKGSRPLELLVVGALMVVIGFSTIGVVVIRANANPPINMNDPSDPMRLLPYLNREQYGERPLFYGPNFTANPIDSEVEPRYGKQGDRYEIVDEKITYVYPKNSKVFLPRMGDNTQNRPEKYRLWINKPKGEPNFFDNMKFLFRYQLGWMYWRYFFWNFAGRQNGDQGYYSWDKSAGHWLSGIKWLDEARLYNMDHMPETMRKDKARNRYFLLPFLFGLLGVFFHFNRRPNDALAMLAMFVITGIGIIVYSNQPPNEPRERDYVLVGSFFTYCIWLGMGVLAVFELLRRRLALGEGPAAWLSAALVLSAPALMGFQNFDDHSRRHHTGARDYAANFLESCAPNAIIFTYGDNDTYPLWYAQEVEGIRTDVRVVNLSLIAVDWYINQLRRRVNDSPPIKLTIPAEAYRGKRRNSVIYYNPSGQDREMTALEFLQFIGESHPLQGQGGRRTESYMPTRKVYIPVDRQKAFEVGAVTEADTGRIVNRLPINLAGRNYLLKDDLAILDVIASNIWERPIYFAVTCRPDKMFGLDDYMQLEGLALRIIPVKSQSDPNLYIYGNGRVDADKVYDNVMNKFRWGGFDRYELHVDRSYGPSIQSHRLIMLRAAREFVRRGEKQKARDLVLKYLEVFPHMNFPYDWNTMQMLNILVQADGYEDAKPHLQILAEETADWLEFYFSLDPEDLDPETGSFGQGLGLAMSTKDALLRTVEQQKDEAFLNELKELFAPYDFASLPTQ
ncbi:MAG: DUF2723 domain-containing protein [Bacteroidetes bacterium]|nr:MAG: DUF2723 domain-containing protein [Bacteroidota bacterium]